MACVENIRPANPDSEMEEGEIVDEYDDISSDEELLLRQRLHILETYNNVLERKKAKDFSTPTGKKPKIDSLSRDLSEISASDLDDGHLSRNNRSVKLQKRKKKNDLLSIKITTKNKNKKKLHRKNKLQLKVVSESSEESDDEYRNKRRKLENAVAVHKDKNDTSSLSARLKKMLNGPQNIERHKNIVKEDKLSETEKDQLPIVITSPIGSPISDENSNLSNDLNQALTEDINKPENNCAFIDLCDDGNSCENIEQGQDMVDSAKINEECDKRINLDSDEDLELLRKHALETKSTKAKSQDKEVLSENNETENKNFMVPEDDDNYTAELRLICLKSAYLKKAFEIKRKQKLRKRLSQSSIMPDDIIIEQDVLSNKLDSQNNTDIESVDMDIGSDGDEKLKEFGTDSIKNNGIVEDVAMNLVNNNICTEKSKDDELEEDEDLLRAKLLTSLSKNLPNLMDTSILAGIEEVIATDTMPVTENSNKMQQNDKNKQSSKVPEPKKFIIQLGESDSEGEHEATKNLTKMHMKQQQTDFEQQLDMFLKSTRKKVENQQIPNILEVPVKTPEKFVPKSVKHLPKSEQIEYKNLVKRMAELEKMKQARQSAMNTLNKPVPPKDTLKPRNVTVDSKLSNSNTDEQIALSRKKIAEESANMIRLREEATKLSQKYKIVATELKNIATAIALNKKQQKSAQIRLSKIRTKHQMLLKSSTFSHSQTNGFLPSLNRTNNKIIATTKLQKENNPRKEEHKNTQILKSMKVSVVNDLNDSSVPNPMLAIQVDVTNNKKVVKLPKSPLKDKHIEEAIIYTEVERKEMDNKNNESERTQLIEPVEKESRDESKRRNSHDVINREDRLKITESDDYESPLQALVAHDWKEGLNAFFCPFEVEGSCKDPDCKYFHPKTPSTQ